MGHNVFVTRAIPEPGLELLRENCETVDVNPHDRVLTRSELLEGVRGRDGVLCLLTDAIDAEVMDAARGAAGFANFAVGYNNIDLPAAAERGLMISNTPGVLTDATADQAWALLFAAARRVVESDKFFRSGKWDGWGPMQFLGADVTGRTLGVVGAGRIGEAFALKSKGFNMAVLYADEKRNERLERELGAKQVPLDALLAQSDFVSIHVPLNEETTHLIGAGEFVKMRPSAVLVNTSRGPTIDEAALVQALRDGQIAAAGLDVYEDEPVPKPGLTDLDNVVCCPHTASATVETRTKMALMAAENLVAMLEGRRPPNLLNTEVVQNHAKGDHDI